MAERIIRVYFSGCVEKEIPEGIADDKIFDMKEEICATLTAKEIGCCMTEDDWSIFPNNI